MRYCVGIVGYGYWGPILLHNFIHHEGFFVKWVCDRNEERHESAKKQYGTLQFTKTPSDLLLDEAVDVIVIATQASSHYRLCREALLHRKHVFIEKPLTLSFAEAEDLCHTSKVMGKSIFVDHTWLFSPGYKKLREVLHSGFMGKIFRINSRRCDFGIFQQDSNVLWHLMYHDVYLLNDLLQSAPLHVQAHGTSIVLPNIIDGASATLNYSGDVQVNVLCDMYFPEKIREFIVQCERGILVWDEMQQNCLHVINRHATQDLSSDEIIYCGDGSKINIPVEEKDALPLVLDEFHKELLNPSHGNCFTVLQTVKIIEMLDESLSKARYE